MTEPLKGLAEFRETDEFGELQNHRIKLLDFYSSEAFQAQQAFFDAAMAIAHNAAFAGKTVEERERGRAEYLGLKRAKSIPELIAQVLTDEIEGQEKKA